MYNIFVKYTCKDGKREAFVETLGREGIVKAIRAEVWTVAVRGLVCISPRLSLRHMERISG